MPVLKCAPPRESEAALTDNWTHGAVGRHTTAPISHTKPLSGSLGKLLLISCPAAGRRLSWSELTVG